MPLTCKIQNVTNIKKLHLISPYREKPINRHKKDYKFIPVVLKEFIQFLQFICLNSLHAFNFKTKHFVVTILKSKPAYVRLQFVVALGTCEPRPFFLFSCRLAPPSWGLPPSPAPGLGNPPSATDLTHVLR